MTLVRFAILLAVALLGTDLSLTPRVSASAFAGGVAQTNDAAFEVASIRPCNAGHLPGPADGGRGGGANSVHMTPGRLRILCMTVATLIRTAYGYVALDSEFDANSRMEFGAVYGVGTEDGRRVRGGPDWIRSERYTIEAVAHPGMPSTPQDIRGPMLRRLLEQRFQLNAHVDEEKVSAYALTVAKGGLRIKPVAADACDELPGRPGSPVAFGHPVDVVAPRRRATEVRRGHKPSCGLSSERNGPNVALVGGDVPLEVLPLALALRLGGIRVLNRTGVNDRFNFVLEFAVDDNTPGVRRTVSPESGAELEVPPAATIFSALDEQLGLKLERVQVPREFIVVDRVERPTEN